MPEPPAISKAYDSMEERCMSSPLLGASDFDLDALDAFLMSDRAPEDSMQLSGLDGFLSGIAHWPGGDHAERVASVIGGGAGHRQALLDSEVDRHHRGRVRRLWR